MKVFAFGAATAALVLGASTASAQTFTYEVTWEPVENVGGLMRPDGPQYYGGSVEGAFVTTRDDGSTVSGTMKCVGTGQPDGGIFAIHMSCTAKSDNGKVNIAYGCNYLGEPGPETALGCVGGIQTKMDDGTYVNGSATMHWYSNTKSTGTGQWYVDSAGE